MTEHAAEPKVSVGFASEKGLRKQNEDFVAAVLSGPADDERRDVVVALADGIGGAKGGRVAAETAVRGFLDGLWDVPETMEIRKAGARILNSLNGWMHSQGRQDPSLAGMGCTFTALVLRGRTAHLLHVGDSRCYRLSGDRLTRLSTDHVREGPGRRVLYRALGVEAELRLDYAAHPMALHDRFMLCSDGVHGFLSDEVLADMLRVRSAPQDASRALVHAALEAGSNDNCTALVLDIVGVPSAQAADVGRALMALPMRPAPRRGETIDGFQLTAVLSEGTYSRLFTANDEIDGGEVVLKFPKGEVEAAVAHRAEFVREAWVGARVRNPWVGQVIELPPGRQTCLYTVMPRYRGQLLQARMAHSPAIGLEEGRGIALKLCHAVASLHRAGVIHRDIKPDNIILEQDGGLKLLDLGVVRLPGLEDEPPKEIPGTAAYMAPEMFDGEPGNEQTDIYALGVTLYRAFTGEFPYGNTEATSRARLDRPKDFSVLRPDLPAWLADVIGRAIVADPMQRYLDVVEFAEELEAGPAAAPVKIRREPTAYERYKLQFWQGLAALLALGLLVSLLRH